MSYFSHNPEAYDEIIAKALAQKLSAYSGLDCEGNDVEEIESNFRAFISNLQCDHDPRAKAFYDYLMQESNDLIVDQEQAYWERFIP